MLGYRQKSDIDFASDQQTRLFPKMLNYSLKLKLWFNFDFIFIAWAMDFIGYDNIVLPKVIAGV